MPHYIPAMIGYKPKVHDIPMIFPLFEYHSIPIPFHQTPIRQMYSDYSPTTIPSNPIENKNILCLNPNKAYKYRYIMI